MVCRTTDRNNSKTHDVQQHCCSPSKQKTHVYNEARERKARAFSWFSKVKKPLHNGSNEHRVPCFEFLSLCVWVCLFGSTRFSATFIHRAQRKWHQCHSRWALCTHTLTKPSRVDAVVSRSELVELGAASCVLCKHMAGPWCEKNRTVKYHTRYETFFFVFCLVPPIETQL